ncbi:MAG: bacterial ammonia monooxygenase, subunit AmoB [Panacagrimonas sp.]
MRTLKTLLVALLGLVTLLMAHMPVAMAHGERAQMPQLRMRAVHWIDVEFSTVQLSVNDILKITGKFMPSEFWPHHVNSIEDTAYLNIGVPGPSFVRLESRVNGVPMIRSTSFRKGELYDFEIVLKARKPGRYHVHTVINVKGTGPIIGPAIWVEVTGDPAVFENTANTLLGQTIDLESYGFSNVKLWSALWFAMGLAWFLYWLTKCPIAIPRFKRVSELGPDADRMITTMDRRIGGIFLVLTVTLIAGGFVYAQEKWPITTPLQTGKIDVPPLEQPVNPVNARLIEARYRIPGRSFRLELDVTNTGDSPVTVGEFAAGNLRFINAEVLDVQPRDEHDLVASDALRVEGAPVAPGETRRVVLYADDAMWETERMTTMIASPDAVVAGLLFFFDERGQRHLVEFGGPMIPDFGMGET